jgi:hypothetical protein
LELNGGSILSLDVVGSQVRADGNLLLDESTREQALDHGGFPDSAIPYHDCLK